MSFEGRIMGMPAPASLPKTKPATAPDIKGSPAPIPVKPGAPIKKENQNQQTGEEFKTTQAEKLLEGLTTPEELAIKFGPGMMDAIMKKAQAIGEYKTYGLGDSYQPPETLYPKIPHPLHGIVPRVLEHYNRPGRTQEDEDEYIDLLNELREDRDFAKILKQYEKLMELYPDRTEEYEMKAMKDFVEMNAKLSS